MPTVWDHLLVLFITVLLPVHDLLFWYPRILRAGPNQIHRARRHAYRESMVVLWTLTAAACALWVFKSRVWSDIGVEGSTGWGFWVGLLVSAGVIVGGTWQRLSISRNREEDVRESVLEQIEPLRPLLPHTQSEMVQFGLVSLTAGICEEVLFRGFLIWYLASLIPFVPALIVSALLFGMAHAYQGVRGVLLTGAVGLGLAILYVLSGSLWLPMAVHAFVDINSGLLAYTFLAREQEEITW